MKIKSECEQGGAFPPAITKGPQAFGLEDGEPQVFDLEAQGGVAPIAALGGVSPTSALQEGLARPMEAASSSGSSQSCCALCGHQPGTGLCCGDETRRLRACATAEHERSAKRERFTTKSRGCLECQGPCNLPTIAAISCLAADPRPEADEELEELNRHSGNWRHKKARNAAIQEAALRRRAIPNMAEAQTDAQRRMATIAARFREQ